MLLVVPAAFYVRAVPPRPIVYPAPGDMRFFDTDPYYHLRHTRYAVAHYPHIQRWDPGLYPAGLPALYAGLYDLSMATAAMVIGLGHPTEDQVDTVAAWTAPVLGAATFIAIYWAVAGAAGPWAGAVAALLLLLYPGTFLQRSLLGYPDHHVAEVLLGILTAGGLIRCLKDRRTDGRRAWWRPAVLHALPMSLFLFTWFGAPIYLLLIGATVFLTVNVAILTNDAPRLLARNIARYGLGMLVVFLPLALLAPWLLMKASLFSKLVGSIIIIAVGLPVYLLAVEAALSRIPARIAGIPARLLAVVLSLGLAIAAFYLALEFVADAQYLIDQVFVVKSYLVKEQGDVTLKGFLWLGGAPALIALLAVPMVLVLVALRRDTAALLPAVLISTAVVWLWYHTHDYGYAAGPFLDVLAALVIVRIGQAISVPLVRVLGGAVLAAAIGGPAVAAIVAKPDSGNSIVMPAIPLQQSMARLMLLNDGWVQALRWMREHTPPLAVPLDAPTEEAGYHHPIGNYGVLAFWDFGHYINAIAFRPVLASGGISAGVARWFLTIGEEAGEAALKGDWLAPTDEIKYIIADGQTAGDFVLAAIEMIQATRADYLQDFKQVNLKGARVRLWVYSDLYRKSMINLLYADDGAALAHYRMVYASRQKSALAYVATMNGGMAQIRRHATLLNTPEEERSWRGALARPEPVETAWGMVYEGFVTPSVKVFEHVKGAQLVGDAPPGAEVTAELGVRSTDASLTIHYRRTAVADSAGRYAITVAYPTILDDKDGKQTDFRAQSSYVIHVVEGGTKKVLGSAAVGTAAVRAGTPVPVTPSAGG